MGTKRIQSDKNVAVKKDSESKSTIYVVAIAASAGGLDAINSFFDKVPLNNKLGFILIQHLSPDYKSMMPELLTKHTNLKIIKVTDDIPVEANCIYTIPADKNITISKGRLFLEDRGSPKTLNLPANIFLKSLAEDQKRKAIAVILSGTGSDGTLGAESIKEHGGMVIAQDPQTAAFDSMPKSIISTGLTDFILNPSQMPETIIKYIQHPYAKQLEANDENFDATEENEIEQILNVLHKKTNFDFRQYKKATINRRIERRMGIKNLLTKSQYIDFLEDDADEHILLTNDILIGVTGFFRDKKAFEFLDNEVLSKLISEKEDGKELRLWIIGCSTGQEVYSFAILLKEQCRLQGKSVLIKIFATDADQRALDTASKGIYLDTIHNEIPKNLINRYFSKIDEGKYQINKEIREMAIFAKHDITRDPPFNNIHLASCRNLLIYIEPLLQEKVLAFIHFSLTEDGYLFLGSSETLGTFSKAFTEIHKKYKIYKNKSLNRIVDLNRLLPLNKNPKSPHGDEKSVTHQQAVSESIVIGNFKDALLEDLVPPTVIVNDNLDIVHVAGAIDRYLKLPKKQLSLNIFKMVDDNLYVALSNSISKVKSSRKKTVSPIITFENEHRIHLNIIAKPYTEPIGKNSYFIISFIEIIQVQDQMLKQPIASDPGKEKDEHIRRLEDELKETKEYLQAAIEELETSNEELQATNEELMAANEELQSSNEELQSVNEELYTVNNEFQDKIMEMTELNDDLNNFIQSTNIATLFLDEDLNIKRFTDILTPLIKITSSDIGRHIGDFNHVFKSFNLINTSKLVLETSKPQELEVVTEDNDTYLTQALPYITSKGEVKGVVITFVYVTEIKEIEHTLKKQRDELELSNQELEQFAYLAAHDLKAPITNLDALVNMIDSNYSIKHEKNFVAFGKLQEVIGKMNSTISILNEVITIKKNLHLKPELLDLNEELKDVLSSIDEQIITSNSEIKYDFSNCKTIFFPAVHMQGIMQNLITNAIKYRRENAKPVINITSDHVKGYARLIVSDNGRGLDLDLYKDKLFGLFQRFHLDVKGKGIGLHITKSIIEKYGGFIEVDSKVDVGTTFRIYFIEDKKSDNENNIK